MNLGLKRSLSVRVILIGPSAMRRRSLLLTYRRTAWRRNFKRQVLLRRGLSLRGQCLRRTASSVSRQQTHIFLVLKQLVLQLHVHRFFLDFLHLIVDRGGAQLHSCFGGGRAAIDLVAHLVEGRGIVTNLERSHRLRELLLQFSLFRLVD